MEMPQDVKRGTASRIGLAYTAIGGLLVLLTQIAMPALGVAPWLPRLMITALVMGFPFVMVIAWALTAGPLEGSRAKPRPWDQQE